VTIDRLTVSNETLPIVPGTDNQRVPRHYRGWQLAYVIFIHEFCPAVAALWGHRLPSLEAGKSLVDPIPQNVGKVASGE
jgi:hypothetical protein